MPPRFFTLAVVACWLGTSGWLFYRDLWPKLRPGEPPPYTIDLVEEARQHELPTRWSILRGGKEIGKAYTRVKYREEDDTFELHGTMKNLKLYHDPDFGTVTVREASNLYRVGRDGELREIMADWTGDAHLAGERCDFKIHAHGQVRDHYMLPAGWVEGPDGRKELNAEPVRISTYGAVLNPLHPVNRVLGLHPGQHWRMPLVDPLSDVLATIGKLPGTRSVPAALEAHVSQPQNLPWAGQDVPCLVIEYRDEDDAIARTWVRESDGLVLRQEARRGGLAAAAKDWMILQREP
jgi:hypothetical protein